MSRNTSWRRTCPDALLLRINEGFEARLFILRNTGPTGFLLKQEEHEKEYKVCLGDPHTCTCHQFMKDRELCIHIIWVITKKFRVEKENPIVWQLGLNERDLNGVMSGAVVPRKQPVPTKAASAGDERGKIVQRPVGEGDMCPICQDDIHCTKEPLTFCKFGCGNSVHMKCMKMCAQYQNRDQNEPSNIIKCPLCRCDFATFAAIMSEYSRAMAKQKRDRETRIHRDAACRKCDTSPIQGKCYRCLTCQNLYLCNHCFSIGYHMEHNFEYRAKTTQHWRPMPQRPASEGNFPLEKKMKMLSSEERQPINFGMSISSFVGTVNRKVKSKNMLKPPQVTRYASQPDMSCMTFEISGMKIKDLPLRRASASDARNISPRFQPLPPISPTVNVPPPVSENEAVNKSPSEIVPSEPESIYIGAQPLLPVSKPENQNKNTKSPLRLGRGGRKTTGVRGGRDQTGEPLQPITDELASEMLQVRVAPTVIDGANATS